MAAQKLTDADLRAIRERADKATPGPWVRNAAVMANGGLLVYISQAGHHQENVAWVSTVNSDRPGEDAAFIAHARDDIPALLTEVSRLRAEIEKLQHRRFPQTAAVTHQPC